MRRRPSGVILMLIATAVLPATFVAGYTLAPDPPPAGAAPPPRQSGDYALETSRLTDARTVPLAVRLGPPGVLRSDAAGTVTERSCRPGDAVTSGSTIVSVDGRPLLVLHTHVPLWRDLERGDAGPDVTALQEALAALGRPVAGSGVLDAATLEAYNAALRGIGAAERDAVLRADVVWLPVEAMAVQRCGVGVGDPVAAGITVAVGARSVTEAVVATRPTAAVPGERVAVVDGQRLALDEDGRLGPDGLRVLQDSAALRDALARSPDAMSDDGGDAAVQVDVVSELAEPATAWAVPPAAITGVRDGTGCVWAGEAGYVVRIVASQLGKAYVAFDPRVDPPPAVSLLPSAEETCG